MGLNVGWVSYFMHVSFIMQLTILSLTIPHIGSLIKIPMTSGGLITCYCPDKIYYTLSGDMNLRPHVGEPYSLECKFYRLLFVLLGHKNEQSACNNLTSCKSGDSE